MPSAANRPASVFVFVYVCLWLFECVCGVYVCVCVWVVRECDERMSHTESNTQQREHTYVQPTQKHIQ